MRLKNLSEVLTAWMLTKGAGRVEIKDVEWQHWNGLMPSGYTWDGFQHLLREGYIQRTRVTTEYFEITERGKKLVDRQRIRMQKREAQDSKD